jgi:hypothetical protein
MLLLALVATCVCALAPAGAAAATIHVDATNGARTLGCGTAATPCAVLADALAVAGDGDAIEIAPGDYDAAPVSRELTLRGVGTGSARIHGQLALDAPATLSRLVFSGLTSGVLVHAGAVGASISSNSFDGSATPIQVDAAAPAGVVIARGNRIVGGPLVNASALASIDARRNWWGANAGTSALLQVGAVDVSDPLHLAGITAPARMLPGSTGEYAVTLVGADGIVEQAASGFDVTFSTSAGTLDATHVTFARGRAAALLTATDPATVSVTAILDAEQLTTSTDVRAATRPEPGNADAPAVTVAHPVRARLRVVRRGLAHAVTDGLRLAAVSNQPASVYGWAYVDARVARQLGLRDPKSASLEPYIIGKVHTRAAAGSRVVHIVLSDRARYAMGRYDRRLAVYVVGRISTSAGASHYTWRRLALPANVR